MGEPGALEGGGQSRPLVAVVTEDEAGEERALLGGERSGAGHEQSPQVVGQSRHGSAPVPSRPRSLTSSRPTTWRVARRAAAEPRSGPSVAGRPQPLTGQPAAQRSAGTAPRPRLHPAAVDLDHGVHGPEVDLGIGDQGRDPDHGADGTGSIPAHERAARVETSRRTPTTSNAGTADRGAPTAVRAAAPSSGKGLGPQRAGRPPHRPARDRPGTAQAAGRRVGGWLMARRREPPAKASDTDPLPERLELGRADPGHRQQVVDRARSGARSR